MEAMTVEQVQTAKRELEKRLLVLIREFEDQTGLYVAYIHTAEGVVNGRRTHVTLGVQVEVQL